MILPAGEDSLVCLAERQHNPRRRLFCPRKMAADKVRARMSSDEGVRAAFQNLTRCYQDVGKPERLEIFTYGGPHKFPAPAQQRMLEWFDRWV